MDAGTCRKVTRARLVRSGGSAALIVLANVGLVAYFASGNGTSLMRGEPAALREIDAYSAPAPTTIAPSPPAPSPAGVAVQEGPSTSADVVAAPAPAGASIGAPAPAPVTASAAGPVAADTTVPPVRTVPPYGRATAWGCPAAVAYLRAYAAPEYAIVCPGNAEGAQALTCFARTPCGPTQRLIVIADPCPAAYMNEAHNSWVLNAMGTSTAPLPGVGMPPPDGSTAIDPWGSC